MLRPRRSEKRGGVNERLLRQHSDKCWSRSHVRKKGKRRPSLVKGICGGTLCKNDGGIWGWWRVLTEIVRRQRSLSSFNSLVTRKPLGDESSPTARHIPWEIQGRQRENRGGKWNGLWNRIPSHKTVGAVRMRRDIRKLRRQTSRGKLLELGGVHGGNDQIERLRVDPVTIRRRKKTCQASVSRSQR